MQSMYLQRIIKKNAAKRYEKTNPIKLSPAQLALSAVERVEWTQSDARWRYAKCAKTAGNHYVASHATANKTKAVTLIKTIIEPNRIAVSLTKSPALIAGSFVALYTTAIAAVNGNSHSTDCGVVPIFSGVVNVAIMIAATAVIFDLWLSRPRGCGPGTRR